MVVITAVEPERRLVWRDIQQQFTAEIRLEPGTGRHDASYAHDRSLAVARRARRPAPAPTEGARPTARPLPDCCNSVGPHDVRPPLSRCLARCRLRRAPDRNPGRGRDEREGRRRREAEAEERRQRPAGPARGGERRPSEEHPRAHGPPRVHQEGVPDADRRPSSREAGRGALRRPRGRERRQRDRAGSRPTRAARRRSGSAR